jgi:hypothetical protein
MSKLRRTAEEVAGKADTLADELSDADQRKALKRYAGRLRDALEHEQRELNDMTGRRYGDNISLLCTFLAGLISNGEKRGDAHGTAMSLRDDLQRLADDDEFWLQQCQMAKALLDAGGFPRYEDEG